MKDKETFKEMMKIASEMSDLTDRLVKIDCVEAAVLGKVVSLWGMLFTGGISGIYAPNTTKALFTTFFETMEKIGMIAESLENIGGPLNDTSFTLSDRKADII